MKPLQRVLALGIVAAVGAQFFLAAAGAFGATRAVSFDLTGSGRSERNGEPDQCTRWGTGPA